jgi:diacylglycerol kinase (ATP)
MGLNRFVVIRNLKRWNGSANNAVEGILAVLKRERHLRFHLFSVFFILLLSFILGLDRIELIIIILVSLPVIVFEMFNSAIESIVDLVTRQKNPLAGMVKDIAAGAVLVSAVAALVVGFLIFYPHLARVFREGFMIARHPVQDIGALSIIMVSILIVSLKSISRGTGFLSKVFPSGRAAFSFSIFITLAYSISNLLVLCVGFLVATLLSMSRMKGGKHKFVDILTGAVIGALTSFVLFGIFC